MKFKKPLVKIETREIKKLHRKFIEAEKRGEIGTSDELWQHFGLKPPTRQQQKALKDE